MPSGGRRPGAGAPRGNLNAARAGGRSQRLQIVLAALLSEPEIREIILGLLLGGEEAHREFRELVVTSARVLYERPINEELRQLANRVASAHIEKLGTVGIREAVLQYRGQLGFEDLLPPTDRTSAARRNNPVFREFCRLLLGIDPAKLPSPQSINSDTLAALISESEDPQFATAVIRAIKQSNPHSNPSAQSAEPPQ